MFYAGFEQVAESKREPLVEALIAEVALRSLFVSASAGQALEATDSGLITIDHDRGIVTQSESRVYRAQRAPRGHGEEALWVTLADEIYSDVTTKGAVHEITSAITTHNLSPRSRRALAHTDTRPILRYAVDNQAGRRLWDFADPEYSRWLIKYPRKADDQRQLTTNRLRRLAQSRASR